MAAPREWVIAEHRKLFGHVAKKEWCPATNFFEQAEQLAAMRQDAACGAMRRATRTAGLFGEELSQRLGHTKAHVGRRLRREEWLDWKELHEWACAVGTSEVLAALNVEFVRDGDASTPVGLNKLAGPTEPPETVFRLP